MQWRRVDSLVATSSHPSSTAGLHRINAHRHVPRPVRVVVNHVAQPRLAEPLVPLRARKDLRLAEALLLHPLLLLERLRLNEVAERCNLYPRHRAEAVHGVAAPSADAHYANPHLLDRRRGEPAHRSAARHLERLRAVFGHRRHHRHPRPGEERPSALLHLNAPFGLCVCFWKAESLPRNHGHILPSPQSTVSFGFIEENRMRFAGRTRRRTFPDCRSDTAWRADISPRTPSSPKCRPRFQSLQVHLTEQICSARSIS